MIEELMKLEMGDSIVADTLFPNLSDGDTYLDVIELKENEKVRVLGLQLFAFGVPVNKLVVSVDPALELVEVTAHG